MPDKSNIRVWNGEAASLIEESRDGKVVVTVGEDRRTMGKDEWERLPEHKGEPPRDFSKAEPDATPAQPAKPA